MQLQQITAQTLAWVYVLIQIPSLFLVYWAFATHGSQSKTANPDPGGYFGAVIPVFGKKTAIGVAVYTLATCILVLIFSYDDPIDEVALLTMTTINACFLVLLALAALFFKLGKGSKETDLVDERTASHRLDLFVRTLPWIFIQVAACIALYLSHYLVRQDLGESELTDRDDTAIIVTVIVLVGLPVIGLIAFMFKVGKLTCPNLGGATLLTVEF